jgi:uncharacterized protein (DUF58 family)
VRWLPTAKLQVFVGLIAAGLLGGLASGRPEPVLLVVPFAVAAAVGVASVVHAPGVRIVSTLDHTRVTEGDAVVLTIELHAEADVPQLDLIVDVPLGLVAAVGERSRTVRLRGGEQRRIVIEMSAERWGRYDLGEVWVRARSTLDMFTAEGHALSTHRVLVHPHPETLRRLVRARRTQLAAGNQLARAKGRGVDFADIRPLVSGDRVREINWRVTARRGTPWVNERHPDRSTDVVIFLDAFEGVTLTAAVRAATSLASAYLEQRDRVGLVSFGGTVTWLRPGTGLRQQYRVVDTLLATRPFENVAWKDITLLPPRVLPPSALVVVVSPLEDDRMLQALVDMRVRGIDLVVIEVSPMAYIRPGPGLGSDIAYRLWQLQRETRRDGYRSMGVPVVEWWDGQPLAEAVEVARAWPWGRLSWTG